MSNHQETPAGLNQNQRLKSQQSNINQQQSSPRNISQNLEQKSQPIHQSLNSVHSMPSLQSVQSQASINYNQAQENIQNRHQNEQIDQNRQNDKQAQQELQKVNLQKEDFDQDQILRMFREQGTKKVKTEQHREKQNKLLLSQKDSKTPQTKKHHKPSQISTNVPSKGKQEKIQKMAMARQHSQKEIFGLEDKNWSLSARQLQKVKNLVMQYKIQYRPSIYDTEWQKDKYGFREQFFQYLCIGVQQIRNKAELDQTALQRQLLSHINNLNQMYKKSVYEFGTFKFCRNFVNQIDLEMFKQFHKKGKSLNGPLSEDYKGQWRVLLTNLKDVDNSQLRKKILTQQMTVQKIKTGNQLDFVTQSRRAEIKAKQTKLLAQFSSERQKIVPSHQPIEQEKVEYPNMQPQQEKESKIKYQVGSLQPQNAAEPKKQQLTYSRFVDEGTVSLLQQLLSKDHLYKMRQRIEQDLKEGQQKQNVLSKFTEEFIVDL